MINRKKKIIFIQVTIFLIAASLLFYTCLNKNKKIEKAVKIELETNPNTNSFDDIEYSGFDLNGNRYTLKAGTADFETETPDSINMIKVVANFYLKNTTVLTVISDTGLYNNITIVLFHCFSGPTGLIQMCTNMEHLRDLTRRLKRVQNRITYSASS